MPGPSGIVTLFSGYRTWGLFDAYQPTGGQQGQFCPERARFYATNRRSRKIPRGHPPAPARSRFQTQPAVPPPKPCTEPGEEPTFRDSRLVSGLTGKGEPIRRARDLTVPGIRCAKLCGFRRIDLPRSGPTPALPWSCARKPPNSLFSVAIDAVSSATAWRPGTVVLTQAGLCHRKCKNLPTFVERFSWRGRTHVWYNLDGGRLRRGR
jgi:hypothetical protein